MKETTNLIENSQNDNMIAFKVKKNKIKKYGKENKNSIYFYLFL